MHGNADGQDAGLEAGLDVVSVGRVGEEDPAGEGAHHPLADERLLPLGVLLRPLRADGQHAAVHGHLDAVGVDARQVEAEHDVIRPADGVHAHAGMRPDGGHAR